MIRLYKISNPALYTDFPDFVFTKGYKIVLDAANNMVSVNDVWYSTNASKLNEIINVSVSPSTQSTSDDDYTLIDQPNENTTFVGLGVAGAFDTSLPVWRIKRIDIVGTITTVSWADGNKLFDNIWDNRAALTYKFYGQE